MWTRTLGAAFKDPVEEARPIANLERALGFGERLPRQLFLGTIRGRPVTTAMLFAQPPAAGIYNVGVLERYRGRGIGSAMMRAALADGRKRGCAFGTLFATAMGAGLYRNLGFEDVGKMEIWANKPKAAAQG
jgi:ribosomal protein S18 acetylase RimI-like enzyme